MHINHHHFLKRVDTGAGKTEKAQLHKSELKEGVSKGTAEHKIGKYKVDWVAVESSGMFSKWEVRMAKWFMPSNQFMQKVMNEIRKEIMNEFIKAELVSHPEANRDSLMRKFEKETAGKNLSQLLKMKGTAEARKLEAEARNSIFKGWMESFEDNIKRSMGETHPGTGASVNVFMYYLNTTDASGPEEGRALSTILQEAFTAFAAGNDKLKNPDGLDDKSKSEVLRDFKVYLSGRQDFQNMVKLIQKDNNLSAQVLLEKVKAHFILE